MRRRSTAKYDHGHELGDRLRGTTQLKEYSLRTEETYVSGKGTVTNGNKRLSIFPGLLSPVRDERR